MYPININMVCEIYNSTLWLCKYLWRRIQAVMRVIEGGLPAPVYRVKVLPQADYIPLESTNDYHKLV